LYLFFATALAMRVDVLRIIIPGLRLTAVLALNRAETWPAWDFLNAQFRRLAFN
jgi:hypothetical protein